MPIPSYCSCYMLEAGELPFQNIRFRYLLDGAGIMLSIAFLLGVAIYATLHLKKVRHFYKVRIHDRLEEWIAAMVTIEEGERIPAGKGLQHIANNLTGRQLLIDELLQCRKDFTGKIAGNIVTLYEQLGLKNTSLGKLNSRHWHVKAQGIMELYRMDQSDTLKRIYKNTNNSHELVRMEAQLGVLHLTGFDGLRFLDVISYPLSEWQQLKLLDQLRHSGLTDNLSKAIPKWLRSPNHSVVLFALKLADEYQQVGLHDVIASCLHHHHDPIRGQTIKTLRHIATDWTPALLASHYNKESPANKYLILSALQQIGTEEELPFLAILLDDDNDATKLGAAKAIARSSGRGLALLAEKGSQRPHPYQAIYLHVKSEFPL
jgi:hypothetical protein